MLSHPRVGVQPAGGGGRVHRQQPSRLLVSIVSVSGAAASAFCPAGPVRLSRLQPLPRRGASYNAAALRGPRSNSTHSLSRAADKHASKLLAQAEARLQYSDAPEQSFLFPRSSLVLDLEITGTVTSHGQYVHRARAGGRAGRPARQTGCRGRPCRRRGRGAGLAGRRVAPRRRLQARGAGLAGCNRQRHYCRQWCWCRVPCC